MSTKTRNKMNQTQIKYSRLRLQQLYNEKVKEIESKVLGKIEAELKTLNESKNGSRKELRNSLCEVIYQTLKKDKRFVFDEPSDVNTTKKRQSRRWWYYLEDDVSLASNVKTSQRIETLEEKLEEIKENVLQPIVDKLKKQRQRVEDEIVLGDCEEAMKLLNNFQGITLKSIQA